MNKSLKASIFVIAIAFILIVSWIWLANIRIRGKAREAIIHFPDVTGLKLNDPVKVWGIEKGSVKEIQFKQNHIEVKVSLAMDVTLYNDAHAEILDVAMISGTKYIALDAGRSGIPLPNGTPIPGKASLGIPLSMIGDVGEKVGKILAIVDSTRLMQSLSSILQNLESATSELAQILKENRADLRETAKSIKTGSQELKEIGHRITKTTAYADSILTDIKKGKGTLGKLTSDDSLYQELTSTLASIRELAQNIKANPRRYIKIF